MFEVCGVMILVVLRHAMVYVMSWMYQCFFFFCVSSKEKCDGSDVFVVIHFFDVMCVSEFISLPNENKICWYYIIFGSFQ